MYLYIVRQGRDGPMKIGCAVDPGLRLISMQTGNPDALAIIGVCKGGRSAERGLAAMFDRHRIRGEWFRPHPDLLRFANSLPSWESVEAGGECPAIRTPSDIAHGLRRAGYTFQEIGDHLGVSRQRAQQLHGLAGLMQQRMYDKLPRPPEDDRPPIAEFVKANPEFFRTTLLIEGDL